MPFSTHTTKALALFIALSVSGCTEPKTTNEKVAETKAPPAKQQVQPQQSDLESPQVANRSASAPVKKESFESSKSPGSPIVVDVGNDFWVDASQKVKLFANVDAPQNSRLQYQWMYKSSFDARYGKSAQSDTAKTDSYSETETVRKATIVNKSSPDAWFKAPAVLSSQIVDIYLVVSDDQGNWSADDVEITINPITPPSIAFSELDFPDKSLLDCVTEAAGTQGITYVDKLHTLRCDNRHIRDLTGLERLTALHSLSLMRNAIIDAAPIGQLTELVSLNLNSNQIGDVRWVAELTQVKQLMLADNPITDARSIAKLKMLYSLNLSETKITDLSFVEDLPGLKLLVIRGLEGLKCSVFRKLHRIERLRIRRNRECLQ